MPVSVTCPTHPEADVTYPGDLILHAAVDHPGEPLADVSDRCIVKQIPLTDVVTRRFRCRYCGAEVTTDDRDRPTYCDLHLDRAT